jgi:hypothetical protein
LLVGAEIPYHLGATYFSILEPFLEPKEEGFMVVREYAQCTVCSAKFVLRVGIGLDDSCAHTFDCPSCYSPITIFAKIDARPSAWIEAGENATLIPAHEDITAYVNLHPSIAFRLEDYHSPIVFASHLYLRLIGKNMRAPAGALRRDAATDFEIPQSQRIQSLVGSVLNLLVRGDPARVLDQQISRYRTLRQENNPTFECKTPFKCIASFFDDSFYPAIGNLRYPLKTMMMDQASTNQAEFNRFAHFYRAELEARHLESYASIFSDYFRHFSQFRQMLVHARVGDEDVDDLVVGAKSFNDIKLYYGQAYETLSANYVVLACLNNISKGRPYDQFESMSLKKYTNDLDKAKKANPFMGNPTLAAFTRFDDSSLRNGSHHASIWRQGDLVKYRSGGTGSQQEISLSRYMHKCNGITIALAALFLVEFQMLSKLRLT